MLTIDRNTYFKCFKHIIKIFNAESKESSYLKEKIGAQPIYTHDFSCLAFVLVVQSCRTLCDTIECSLSTR